jgi:hypothetical protein
MIKRRMPIPNVTEISKVIHYGGCQTATRRYERTPVFLN